MLQKISLGIVNSGQILKQNIKILQYSKFLGCAINRNFGSGFWQMIDIKRYLEISRKNPNRNEMKLTIASKSMWKKRNEGSKVYLQCG